MAQDFRVAAVWEIVTAGATSGILGIGGRFGYELKDEIGFEAQLTRGVGGRGPSGEMLSTFGLRAGRRFHSLDLFGVGRLGFLHCGDGNCGLNPTAGSNFFASFIGGGLEASGRGRRFFRYDFGDTMLNLGSRRNGTRAGLSHSLTISLSLGLRF
jgi:hypothetical protein